MFEDVRETGAVGWGSTEGHAKDTVGIVTGDMPMGRSGWFMFHFDEGQVEFLDLVNFLYTKVVHSVTCPWWHWLLGRGRAK